MRSFLCTFRGIISSILLLSLAFHAVAPITARAAAPSVSMREIQIMLAQIYKNRDQAAKAALSAGLADEVVALEADQFNDVVGNLISDYVLNPQHRFDLYCREQNGPCGLIDQISVRIRSTLQSQKERSATVTVANWVMGVWLTAYTLSFTKEFWATSGSELRGGARFAEVVRRSSVDLKGTVARRLSVYGVGLTAGVLAATLQSLQEKFTDPAVQLQVAQDQLIYNLAKRLHAIATRGLPADFEGLKSVSSEIGDVYLQSQNFYTHAPQLRGKIKLVWADLLKFQDQLCDRALNLNLEEKDEIERLQFGHCDQSQGSSP